VQNFSYCFRNAFFGVGAEDIMTMLNLIDDSAKLTAQLLSQPHAKEFRDAVGSQSPKADLAAALENLVDREVALEDGIPIAAGQLWKTFHNCPVAIATPS
jgi:hypothetical protein